ncbi:hypothetical protein [Vulcanisaeta sp. JCM 16159]|uniref:hypothetical protein n=1 Tax=Vulcanisaeta sp. JCM 16159 TaxID=1295371 RepID=UPI000B0EE031|nr:hypothetical protein [Vulcanisaeta sp. JCM 16159]
MGGIADVEVLDTSEPNYTGPGETIVRLIHEGIEKVLSATPKPIIVTGATDGRYLRLGAFQRLFTALASWRWRMRIMSMLQLTTY